MKPIKIISLLLLALFCAGAALTAETKKEAAQEYDEDTYGPKAPILWEKPVKGVSFSHPTHTMGAGLACDSCHDSLFAQEAGAAEQKDDFTMAKIYAGGYCGACHDGDTAFAAKTRCTACHIGTLGQKRLQQADNKALTPSH